MLAVLGRDIRVSSTRETGEKLGWQKGLTTENRISCCRDFRTPPCRCQGSVWIYYLSLSMACLYLEGIEFICILAKHLTHPTCGSKFCFQARYASLWFCSCQVRLLFLSRMAKYALCISICWHYFLQNGVALTGFMVKDSPSHLGEKDISKGNSSQGHKDILHPLLRSGCSNQPLGYSIFRSYAPSQLPLPI